MVWYDISEHVTLFFVLFFLLAFGYSIDDFLAIKITINSFFRLTFLTLSPALYSYFYGILIFDKKYCSGHPKIKKIWPAALGSILAIFAVALLPPPFYGMLAIFLLLSSFVLVIWIMYFGNDESNSCLLYFKPWRTLININETVEDSSFFSNVRNNFISSRR